MLSGYGSGSDEERDDVVLPQTGAKQQDVKQQEQQQQQEQQIPAVARASEPKRPKIQLPSAEMLLGDAGGTGAGHKASHTASRCVDDVHVLTQQSSSCECSQQIKHVLASCNRSCCSVSCYQNSSFFCSHLAWVLLHHTVAAAVPAARLGP